jgi:alpha-galactosidase
MLPAMASGKHPPGPEQGAEDAGRRTFLLGLGAAAAATAAHASPGYGRPAPAGSLPDVLRVPDRVAIFEEGQSSETLLTRSGSHWQGRGVEVSTEQRQGQADSEVAVFLSAPKTRVTRIRLRWHGAFPAGWRYLGDHWERSYGDLEFRGLAGDRLMPWYFLASNGASSQACGVKTGAAAFCYWQADAAGITLWLDVSNGGSGVDLNDRRLLAATVVARSEQPGQTAFDSAKAFCAVMCEKPLLPAKPVYGSNNWYYKYGNDTSSEASLRDAQLLADLVPASVSNRPFSVIDMGWHAAREGAGPSRLTSGRYPDMANLAAKIKALGVRPGIWTRPTLTAEKRAESWRLSAGGHRPQGDLIVLDPTIPEALDYISENMRLLEQWGYELIKYDYSTFDLLGQWGFEMGPKLTEEGWHFSDQSKTSAEIITALYRAIRKAAGEATLIGCNTVGHLAAGLVQVQRIGDDTSGREWSRTRKMGVNTLAFRMPQHNAFFAADADCVPLTHEIPWNLTQQWLDLVARSGTALFVSADPDALQPAQKTVLASALAAASERRLAGTPLDWFDTTTPERWRLENKTVQFDWYAND